MRAFRTRTAIASVAGLAALFGCSTGPQGLAIDSGGDLRLAEGATDQAATVEFPRMHARMFPLMDAATGIAINEFEHHWFVADGLNDQAEEYLYPGGTLIGVVAGNSGGGIFGVAVDPDMMKPLIAASSLSRAWRDPRR
jgi:hypothetical protein